MPRFGNVPFYVLARFLAFCIDILVVGFALAAFGFNAFERGFLMFAGRDEGGFTSLVAVAFGVALTFAFLCESLFGSTLGKAIFGLRVRRTNGSHAGVVRVFVRYVLRPIDLLVIGPILALVTPRHQRLGDFAGGTVVSHSRVGPLVSVFGVIVLAGLAYAQVAFGGGLDSALGVTAEAANYGPDLVAKGAALVGIALPRAARVPVPVPLPIATSTPTSQPVASAVPAAEPTDTPTDAATDTPTDAPSDAAGAEHV